MHGEEGQPALDFILERLGKETYHGFNLMNELGNSTKKLNKNAIGEAWLKLFLDGWIKTDPEHIGDWLNSSHFKLTSYGKSQLDQIKDDDDYYPVFLDPEATILKLENDISNIDPIALSYFKEALWAIQKNLYMSAAVTMGCASECSIIALIDVVIDYYSDPDLDKKFRKIYSIKAKFELLKDTIRDRGLKKELLPKFEPDKDKHDGLSKLFIDFETILDMMFHIYRINRNDAGHPTGMECDKYIARSQAAMFRKYCKIIYGMIGYIVEAKKL